MCSKKSFLIFSLLPFYLFAFDSELGNVDLSKYEFKPVANTTMATDTQQIRGFNKNMKLSESSISFEKYDYEENSSYNNIKRCRTGL